MAAYLLDTNVLLRLIDAASPQHSVAEVAVSSLLRAGHDLHLTAQNFVEFWAVVTRPVVANGFGWEPGKAAQEVRLLRSQFPVLDDVPGVFARWFQLVEANGVRGKPTHDARLVAVMLTHGIPNLLTFNAADFKAYSEIAVLRPEDAAARAP